MNQHIYHLVHVAKWRVYSALWISDYVSHCIFVLIRNCYFISVALAKQDGKLLFSNQLPVMLA